MFDLVYRQNIFGANNNPVAFSSVYVNVDEERQVNLLMSRRLMYSIWCHRLRMNLDFLLLLMYHHTDLTARLLLCWQVRSHRKFLFHFLNIVYFLQEQDQDTVGITFFFNILRMQGCHDNILFCSFFVWLMSSVIN